MANFIEEFYYGNLAPQTRSTKEKKPIRYQGYPQVPLLPFK